MRQTLRHGLSFYSLLITLAALAIFVGLVTPMIQTEIRAARSSDTIKMMDPIPKLFARASHDNDETSGFIPGTPYSPKKEQRPEFSRGIETLIPRYLEEVPVDAWGAPIYRYGSSLMSNGSNGVPGDEDDVFVKVTQFTEEVDPVSRVLFTDRLEVEAMYQIGFLVLEIQRHIKSGGGAPVDLSDLILDTNRGSPLDPWGNAYELVEVSATKLVSSGGPDGEQGTLDDLVLPWGDSDRYEDDFSRGFQGWVKTFPVGDNPASTPIQWVDQGGPGSHVHFDGSEARKFHIASWVKPPPPGTRISPYARVSCDFAVERTEGTVSFGLIMNYTGPGTGMRGTVTIDPVGGDATLYLDDNTAYQGRDWYGDSPPKAFAGIEVSADSWDFTLTMETLPGTPPQARLTLSGSHAGNLHAELPAAPTAQGAAGIFVQAVAPVSKFKVKVDNFGVYRN